MTFVNVLIVDGYNVIHAVPELKEKMRLGLDAARQALVGFCRRYRDGRGDVERVVIVFDGEGSGLTREQVSPGIQAVFTRRREEADDRILELIRAGGAERFVIVSNDTYVFNNSRAHGAQMMSAAQFAAGASGPSVRRPSAAPPPKPDLTPKEARDITDEYRKHLGL